MTVMEEIEALCLSEGLKVMVDIVGIIINRENATPEQVLHFLNNVSDAQNAYSAFIAPAIDNLENAILDGVA